MNRHVSRLKKMLSQADELGLADDTPRAFPDAWLKLDRKGNRKGPPKSADPNEVKTYLTVLAMQSTFL